jgi:hypothetical protein
MIADIEVKSLPVGIITDSHTDLVNLEKLKDKYSQLICLGDFTSTHKVMGNENDNAVSRMRESGIPCLMGNHEAFIHKVKTGTWPLPFAYSLSRKNLDFIGGLPIGFRLLLPNDTTTLCFHNRPNDLGGHGVSPMDVIDLISEYPIEYNTSAVVTGHNHLGLIRGYKELDVKFVRCASLKDGGFAEIDKDGKICLKNLNYSVEYEDWWKKYAELIDAEAIPMPALVPDLGDYPYYDEKENQIILPC